MFVKIFLVFGFTSSMAATTLMGQTFTFDEFGDGPTPSTMAVDPISGLTTVTYLLPFAGTAGDVLIINTNEPGASASGGLSSISSDVLRFDGNGRMYFFSDFSATDPADSPADVGLPPLPGSFAEIFEIGPEGDNSAFYAPASTMPGFDPSAPTYEIISDVPEPTTGSCVSVGIGFLLILKRRFDGRR